MQSYLVKELLHYCHVRVNHCSAMTPVQISYYDFTFVLEGSMVYVAEGRRMELSRGDAIFLPPGTVRYREEGSTPVRYVSFNFRAAEDSPLPFPMLMQGCITDSMRKLVGVYPESHLIREYHAMEKCICMLNYLLFELLDTRDAASTNPHVTGMLSYIHSHSTERIRLSDISRHMHLSEEYCCALFKRETGNSLIQYINERKMLVARELISSTALRLGAIAERLGFENYNYFSRLYKKHFGDSPAKARRQT